MLWVLKVHIKQKDRATGQVVWFSHYVTEIKEMEKTMKAAWMSHWQRAFIVANIGHYWTILMH